MTQPSLQRREATLIGVVLLAAALLKAADPGHFQAMLSRYGLLPPSWLAWASPAIILAELWLSLSLLRGRNTRRDLLLSEALFYGLSLALVSVLVRGLRIRCACFGVFSTQVTLVHPLACLGVATYLTLRRLTAPR